MRGGQNRLYRTDQRGLALVGLECQQDEHTGLENAGAGLLRRSTLPPLPRYCAP